ncbi:MAG: hypothetical protein KGM95_09670 [Betaproteobacteria bacterium]|nr:hypothetical protein [Betaproteobacteria bacterium]
MKPILFTFFLFILPGLASAQTGSKTVPMVPYPAPDPRVVQLEITLNNLNQAQQSVYQQFLMVQELRRNELQGNLPQAVLNPYPAQASGTMSSVDSNPPLSYDELVRLQRERQERIQKYTRNLNDLYSRYSELEEQKRMVLDQLMDLTKASAQ